MGGNMKYIARVTLYILVFVVSGTLVFIAHFSQHPGSAYLQFQRSGAILGWGRVALPRSRADGQGSEKDR